MSGQNLIGVANTVMDINMVLCYFPQHPEQTCLLFKVMDGVNLQIFIDPPSYVMAAFLTETSKTADYKGYFLLDRLLLRILIFVFCSCQLQFNRAGYKITLFASISMHYVMKISLHIRVHVINNGNCVTTTTI